MDTKLALISQYIHHYSVHALRTHIVSGYISEDIGDVLMDTMQFVERDFILLLDIPKERRLRFIVNIAQETYLQWLERGIINGATA